MHGDRERLTHVPQTTAARQLFAQIADHHVVLGITAKRPREQPVRESHSCDSMPRHSRSSASRDSLSERSAAGVTVK